LFSSVKPAGQTNQATDTLQAILDMARNPTNVGNVSTPPFSLVSPTPPFVPNLGATPPNDWTLGLSYTSATTLGTPAYSFLKTGYQLAVDSVGNVYVVNSPGSTSGNSVAVISPAGKAVGSLLSGSVLGSPRGIAIDTNDNVWVSNNASATNSLVEYTTGGSINTFTSPAVLYGIAINGNNDVFVTEAASQELLELTGGAGTLANVASLGVSAESIAIDPSNNVWVANSASSTVTEAKFNCTTLPCTFGSKVSFTGLTNAFAVAIDQNAIPWVSNASTTNKVTMLDLTTPTSGGTASVSGLGGLSAPDFIAMDGASNLWAPNSTGGSVTEIAAGSTTTALSPSTGFTHTFATPRAIAIDSSGNVWVVSVAGSSSVTTPVLTEIVGAAVPVVTPLSKAVSLNKVGKLP
jgi:sugar lactone lactonase YvrE